MNNVWHVVGTIIDIIESELETMGRHVIKTETIRTRCAPYIDFSCDSNDAEYLVGIGFGQVVQGCLSDRGYRSVRKGMFVNLDRCTDVDYLVNLYKSAETAAEDKMKVRGRLFELAKKNDGQSSLIIVGNKITGIRDGVTEEEFMEKLEADSI